MKGIGRSFLVAFSRYSISPKTKLARNRENCSSILMFVPLVGAIITVIINRWAVLYPYMCEHPVLPAVVGAVIPTILSAGSHLDGFFKTVDALSSHKPREEALAILKEDAHGGYSAIIVSVCYYMVGVGIWSEMPIDGIFVIAFSYIISRALFSISLLTVKHVPDDKSLCYVTDNQTFKWLQVLVNVAYIGISAFLMIEIAASFEGVRVAVASLLGAAISYVYYLVMAKRRFGGVSEEIAGYFVMICEVVIPIAALCAFKSPI